MTNLETVDPITGEISQLNIIRTQFRNPPQRVKIVFDPDEGRTKQEFKDQCDVNKIWAQYVKTGRLDLLNKAQGFYADLSTMPQSYQESLNLVIKARETFDSLPADIRNLFGNDVQAFLEVADRDPDALFDVLKPLQSLDADPATIVAAVSEHIAARPPEVVPDPLPQPVS